MKIHHSGIDTLVVGYGISRMILDRKMLHEKKEQAKKDKKGEGVPVEINGSPFVMMPRGANGYEYIVQNNDLTLSISARTENGAYNPEIYIRASSGMIARMGLIGTKQAIRGFVSKIAVPVYEKISRVDLMVDSAFKRVPAINLTKEVVSRSRKRHEHISNLEQHVNGARVTGYTIGKNEIMCRIYDKTFEIQKSGKEYFYDIWEKNGWDKKGIILRTEFQLRRAALNEFKIDTFEHLEKHLARLWQYLTGTWLRIVKIGKEKNRARWECKKFWQGIQEAIIRFGIPTMQVREKIKVQNFEQTFKQAIGCLMTCNALISFDRDISVLNSKTMILDRIKREMRGFEWNELVKKRAYRYGAI